MSDVIFKIYVEQLRDGQTARIDEVIPAEFLAVNDDDLKFEKPVTVKGEAYLAGENLVLHLVVTAKAIVPCVVCNEPAEVEIHLGNLYHLEPLEEIKGAIFNFKEVLREAILLEAPAFAECDGKCRKRKEIQKYLKKSEETTEEGYHPFANL